MTLDALVVGVISARHVSIVCSPLSLAETLANVMTTMANASAPLAGVVSTALLHVRFLFVDLRKDTYR